MLKPRLHKYSHSNVNTSALEKGQILHPYTVTVTTFLYVFTSATGNIVFFHQYHKMLFKLLFQ